MLEKGKIQSANWFEISKGVSLKYFQLFDSNVIFRRGSSIPVKGWLHKQQLT